MNAAVETSPSQSTTQRRRSMTEGQGQRSGGLNNGKFDTSEPLPVLIRVPNLDAPRPALSRSTVKPEAINETTSTTNEAASSRSRLGTKTQASTAPDAGTATNATGNMLGWLWRMMILGAAIGLVILAYRIINGPASSDSPAIDGSPLNIEAVATSTDTNNLVPPPAPFVTNVETLAPAADQLAAPSTLSPPQLDLESAPVHVAPADTTSPTDDRLPGSADAYAEQPAGETPHDQRRPWASAADADMPRDDGSIRTARNNLDDGWGRQDSHRPQDMGDPRRASVDDHEGQPTGDDGYGGWDSTNQPAPSYDYPETSPNTWRDDARWESTPRNAPHRNGGGTRPALDNYPHSAMRPSEPGVARLHGEIEQPPLRRDDERNRPGIY